MSPKAANSIDAYVAARLRTCRKQLGLSQAEIAKQLGVTFQQIQKYEAGLNRIGAGRLFQFASLYGVAIQDLFPKTVGTADGSEQCKKQDKITAFSLTPEGWSLCEGFQRIKSAQQRRIVVNLIQQMGEQ
ncbi:helix-turn-helix domain-containing protein [Rhizomicrobium electricum]|jgi:transcriptional regulator with XRE-family HTH domain|uniref:Helix-turn-helix transcriptional regulator n=1 Tax=Rhizomicrobium electricum TaxID=480070 RepID=A0ABP3PZQ3_9PROT|nr:helix-turn-helix transcriptional regulator [Rhizomicrobium electricum]NIJ50246.1 transcriptional regulator with XRE-family HTH domain [Rhizomicrobium electricum]